MAQRSIRFPTGIDELIQQQAVQLDRPYSWIVVQACKWALDDHDAPLHPVVDMQNVTTLPRYTGCPIHPTADSQPGPERGHPICGAVGCDKPATKRMRD